MAVSEASASRPPVAKPKPTKLRLEVFSSPQKQTKAKKSKKDQSEEKPHTVTEDVEVVSRKDKQSKKRKREAELSPQDAEDIGEETSGKKSKKKSQRAEENEPDPTTSPDVVVPKKKRKNKTGFPDPSEDTTLSEQSQKCLSYAFLQFHHPSKWKFNKARQNWLIRNIWSKEMIPEVHLPLVYGYLAKVQGGVRENLLQSCLAALEEPKTDVPADNTKFKQGKESAAEPTPSTQPVPLEADTTKETRTRSLIALLTVNIGQ
ncbi:hypothetical protein H0H87_009715 [Tephrocybe sp. NHM501043]|nr:hypothetical protein H0H87_009715 [Tephrocybe sp. NHM501043]